MDCSTPGLPVHHQLLELAQTHVHQVGDAIQSCHPLLSPPPPAFHLSQHQGLFQWVSSSYPVAKVLELHLQHQSFQWTPRTDLLQDGLVGSPCSPRDSQESSPTPQFKSINSSVLRFLMVQLSHPLSNSWALFLFYLKLLVKIGYICYELNFRRVKALWIFAVLRGHRVGLSREPRFHRSTPVPHEGGVGTEQHLLPLSHTCIWSAYTCPCLCVCPLYFFTNGIILNTLFCKNVYLNN